MSGSYVLVIGAIEPATIEVGALGDREFDATANSPPATGHPLSKQAPTRSHSLRSRERHRHIDRLLGHSATRLETAVTFPDTDRECELAERLPGEPIDGFGASDCDCDAHPLATPGVAAIREAAVQEGGVLE